jgi:hypothetical protein
MSVQLQDRYIEPIITGAPAGPSNNLSQLPAPAFTLPGSDGIARFVNPWAQSDPDASQASPGWQGGAMSSIISQLLALISSLMSQSGFGTLFNSGGGSGTTTQPGEQYFTSASGGSTGDPHLSFNGSTWNDMQSESDLLRSDSIPGGYRLSTQTTTPNASGVTYNQRATVTSGHGRTSVSLDKNGNASYTQDGATGTIADGQSIPLDDGETVSRSQNGDLTITNASPYGGVITTTMTQNGQGVDVNVTASNVDLGGTLAAGSPAPPPLPMPPHPVPIRM